MTWEAWLSLAVVVGVVALLGTARTGPGLILLGGLVVVFAAGVVDTGQALSGFSNAGMITVALMYVLVAGIRDTGGVEVIVRWVLGPPRGSLRARLRLLLPVSAMSAFLNNTPVVATYIPAVLSWSRRHNLVPSRFLLPLSYAAILGGTCTLIGTSTNLVVADLLRRQYPEMELGLFDIAWVGVPVLLTGLAYLLLAHRLLPDRRPSTAEFAELRHYTVEMEVEPRGPLVGRTIEEAGLRHLGNLFLVEIERGNNVIAAVGPGERLEAGDLLVFAGDINAVIDLAQIKGLRPSSTEDSAIRHEHPERILVEAVVSNECQLIGRTIREGQFRKTYGASVLAVCRQGQRVEGNLGNIRLRPADTLLLEARPPFLERHRQSRDFLLVSTVDGGEQPRHERAWLAWAILGGVVVTAATGVLSILTAALIGAALMLITRCTSTESATRNLDTQVLLTIAAAFGLSQAMDVTGAAAQVGQGVLALAGNNPYGLLAAAYVAVAALTAVITNNAAAVLMFPIVVSAGEAAGLSPMPFVIATMMAASASFITPIGYQTNLMVYGPGGYHPRDYLIFGGGLNLLAGAVTIIVTPMVWPF